MSTELIELARNNNIHLLCLPANTSHVLQLLDVGVFKSFKTYFSRACHEYMSYHLGCIVTTNIIASLVAPPKKPLVTEHLTITAFLIPPLRALI